MVPEFISIRSASAVAISVLVATLIVGITAEPVGVPRPVVNTVMFTPADANAVNCSMS